MQYSVLGPLEVRDGDRLVDLGSRKQRAVLALLLIHARRVLSVDALIDGLWGEAPPPTAQGTLQAYISNLRRILEPTRGRGQSPSVVVSQSPGYMIEVDPDDLDVSRFEALAARGRASLADGRFQEALEALDDALELWRGPAYGDFGFEPFAQEEIARLKELRLNAIEDKIEAELALGRHRMLIGELRRWVEKEPLRERLRGYLALTLYRDARQAEALAALREGREYLAEELGIDPGPQLRDLEDRLLRQDPTLQWMPSPAQATDATDQRGLVGRRPELEVLARAAQSARSGRGRVLLVAGDPGIGKTALIEEFSTWDHGLAVHWGSCYEGEGAPPFWPWRQILETVTAQASPAAVLEAAGVGASDLVQLVPQLASQAADVPQEAVGDPEEARFRLYVTVASVLSAIASGHPLLLVIDDIHWSDSASLRLLDFAAKQIRQACILIVATYRDVEVAPDHPLASALASIARLPNVERIMLDGLDLDEVNSYVHSVTGSAPSETLVEELHTRTGGNPFFLSELLHLWRDEDRSADDATEIAEGVRKRMTAAEPALPTPPTALIGRDRELRSVDHLLRGNRARLVTLTGPGGVGKTRLAIEVASRLRDEFSDGVTFVDLASLSDANLVLPTIARVLGLRQSGSVRDAIRAVMAPRHLLLVLDNFEHLLDAAVDVAWLLESGARLAVLATSRAALRIRGECEYQVAPLEMPDPGTLPHFRTVGDSPAAQLFVRRAEEAFPGFSLNQNNAGTIAAICWRLEGLPLALELAAAQTRFLGPANVLSRLDQVLQAGGARDLPSRQRTMRATLDWDHDLLSEEERLTFRQLGVFAGGFTLEAAETVVSGEPLSEKGIFVLIGQLVEKSLVMATDEWSSGTSRYRMLEPVRQYSLERLNESGEADAVNSRHARFFAELVGKGGRGLRGVEQLKWLDLLSQEHDNLRAALTHLLDKGDTDEAAEIGWNLWLFWSLRGYAAEGMSWMEALLDQAQGSVRARSKALWVIAIFSYMGADVERTVSILNEVLENDHQLDQETLTHALMLQGQALSQRGDTGSAESLLYRALDLARSTDDSWTLPHALQSLVWLSIAREDLGTAERYVTEANTLARDTGERWTLALGLSAHALIALLQGRDELAERLLTECTALAIALQDPFTIATAAHGLAVTAGRRGDGIRMVHLAGAADALREASALDIATTVWRTLFDREVTPVRESMGSDEFNLVYSEGRSLSLEELIGDFMPAASG